MKILMYIIFLTSTWISVFCQDKLQPLKPNINDVELKNFLLNLEIAIHTKDKDFIIANMNPKMKNSFGGDGGIEEFKNYWNWSSDNSNFWVLMTHIFNLGGSEYKEGDSYSIPYVFSNWPGHEKYDAFKHMAITGTNVNVRDKPDLESSKVIGNLNYDIVKLDYDKSYPPFKGPKIANINYVGEKLWYYIETLDGSLKGFVYWKYIWSPIGYRLGLYKLDGKWLISYLVAGD